MCLRDVHLHWQLTQHLLMHINRGFSIRCICPDFPGTLLGWRRHVRTLVLDLDDTLIHSDWTRGRGWRTFKRPGAEDFLRQACPASLACSSRRAYPCAASLHHLSPSPLPCKLLQSLIACSLAGERCLRMSDLSVPHSLCSFCCGEGAASGVLLRCVLCECP